MDKQSLFKEFQDDLADDNNWASMGNIPARYIGGRAGSGSAYANASGMTQQGIEASLPSYGDEDAFISFTITNSTTANKNINLFNAKTNAFASPYGVPVGVTLVGSPTAYNEYLVTLLSEPRTITKIKMNVAKSSSIATSTASEQFQNAIELKNSTPEGRTDTTPFLPVNYRNETSFNDNLLTIEGKIIPLTSRTELNFILNAETAITFTLTIGAKIDNSNLLTGHPTLKVAY